jgi:hypothetical protein
LEEEALAEINEKFTIEFSNGQFKLTIISFGSMYPNEDESYLRDLQSNFFSLASENIYFEFQGPIFLRSEIIRFKKDLELLLQGKESRTFLIADEEDIEINVKRKKAKFKIEFTFDKIDLKNERWEYYTSFQVDEKNMHDICASIPIK